MKMHLQMFCAVAMLVLGVGTTSAAVYNEIGTGRLLRNAEILPDGTTSVHGLLNRTGRGVDLFGFGWGGGDLTIDTKGTGFDSQLFLFDGDGYGLIHDDDGGPGFLSSIFSVLPGGNYFIGISGYNRDPISAGGRIFPRRFPGPFRPTGPGGDQPLTGWRGPANTSGGQYWINFSGPTTAIPEPATLLLLGIGLAGIGFTRRKAPV